MANLTINRALISDSNGDVVVSNVLADEINHSDGVSSNIQQQLNDESLLVVLQLLPTKVEIYLNGQIILILTSSTQVSNSSYSNNTSNGGYIELANGFQICWCSKSHTYYGSTWTFS